MGKIFTNKNRTIDFQKKYKKQLNVVNDHLNIYDNLRESIVYKMKTLEYARLTLLNGVYQSFVNLFSGNEIDYVDRMDNYDGSDLEKICCDIDGSHTTSLYDLWILLFDTQIVMIDIIKVHHVELMQKMIIGVIAFFEFFCFARHSLRRLCRFCMSVCFCVLSFILFYDSLSVNVFLYFIAFFLCVLLCCCGNKSLVVSV